MENDPILSNTAAVMEVHRHSHTERKKFRHYLFEFFMLFFAVFCGFMAEYFLEHTIEHQREKQFISSMVKDLKDDTSRIRKVFDFSSKQIQGMDTLLRLLQRKPSQQDSVNYTYRLYLQYALNYERVVFNTRTLTQLKNSGGMRLIRNQSVSDSIMSYDAGIQNCDLQFDVVKDSWRDASTFSYQLFDLGSVFMSGGNPDAGKNFLSNDPAIMTAYSSRLLMFAAVVRGYVINIHNQRELATRTIAYLEKEYNLD